MIKPMISIKKIICLTLLSYFAFSNLCAQSWITLINDSPTDGINSSLLDATKLEYYYDEVHDSLWFRIKVGAISSTKTLDIGVNIMINDPQITTFFNFWGFQNNKDAFSKLLSVYVTGNAPSSFTGTVGIADAAGINASQKNFTNLDSGNINIYVDQPGQTIVLGMKRKNLVPDISLGLSLKVAAAVGSSVSWNDDLYASTANLIITNKASLKEALYSEQPTVFPNPAYNHITLIRAEVYNLYVISDAMGCAVCSGILNDLKTISVSDFENGLYFVQLFDATGKEISPLTKFIKTD